MPPPRARPDSSDPEGAAAAESDRDYVVCPEGELPPGTMKLVPVGKFGVGVYNVAGSLYAVTNYCPHEGGPLCLGRVQGMTVPDPGASGKTGYAREGEILRCPWHQWEFDLKTGMTISEPRKRIRTYAVRVEEGQVILTR